METGKRNQVKRGGISCVHTVLQLLSCKEVEAYHQPTSLQPTSLTSLTTNQANPNLKKVVFNSIIHIACVSNFCI